MDDCQSCHQPEKEFGSAIVAADDRFFHLDQEIAAHEGPILAGLADSPKTEPVLRKLLTALRAKLGAEKPPSPSSHGYAKVTCRLCEEKIESHDLDRHTELCASLQEHIMKSQHYSDLLDALVTALSKLSSEDKAVEVLLKLARKAQSIDAREGRLAAVQLARLQHRLMKIDAGSEEGRNYARRISFIVPHSCW